MLELNRISSIQPFSDAMNVRDTRVSFFSFVYLEMSLFPSIFIPFPFYLLYGEYVVRFFLPDGVFLPCDHGLDF